MTSVALSQPPTLIAVCATPVPSVVTIKLSSVEELNTVTVKPVINVTNLTKGLKVSFVDMLNVVIC